MDKSTVMFIVAVAYLAPHMEPWIAILCGCIAAISGWYELLKEKNK